MIYYSEQETLFILNITKNHTIYNRRTKSVMTLCLMCTYLDDI